MVASLNYVRERLAPMSRAQRVDREKAIVYGVKVVGNISGNGREYPAQVLQQYADIYEGKGVNVGHRKSPFDDDAQATMSRFGRLRKLRVEQGELYGDLHYNPKHAFAEPFLWAAEHDPSQYALSHHAAIRWAPRPSAAGNKVAEAILDVSSIDIVGDGGTNASIFESNQGGTMLDVNSIAAEMTDPVILTQFLTDMFAALPGGTFDDAAKKAAVEALMSTIGSAEAVPAEDAPVEDMAPAMESLRRRGKLGAWAANKLSAIFVKEAAERRKQWARTLCTTEGVRPEMITESLVSAVSRMPDEAAAKAVLKDIRSLSGTTGARTSQVGSVNKSAKAMAEEFTVD